jgi:phosphomannomutase
MAKIPKSFPNWQIAVDAGNGMDGLVLPKLHKRLPGIETIQLYWDPDGTFPNHEANPLKVETLKDLQKSVKRNQCVFGAAFDGDGDRVGFVDEEGTPIPGDMLTALFAQELLRERGGGKILYDLRSSWSVPEVIREAGGEPIMCRVGHAHIKKQMREEGALFGGELSMHFYFSDLWNCESGDFAMLLLLKILVREQKPLSAIWKPLRRYAHSGEINFTVKDPQTILSALQDRYQGEASDVSHLDGLRMEFGDWWFNVRPSNTEPLLRLNLEARTVEEMEKRKEEVSALIHAGHL